MKSDQHVKIDQCKSTSGGVNQTLINFGYLRLNQNVMIFHEYVVFSYPEADSKVTCNIAVQPK